ncbi:pseudouridylate synthase 7 homolog [Armigeres subalbatus]|uniref:pseudouridylate synthase 7 homolog n=1 Tax=Armigeres subalbatus TaxID=124917 RepID=UPI002ED03824
MGRDQFHHQNKFSGKPDHRRRGGYRGQPFKSRGQQSGRGRPGSFANSRPPKGSGPVAVSNVKEDQVFITEYVTAGKGFRGILKSRFSDFQVNEIDCDGKEAILTDLELPTPPVSGDKMSTEEAEQELSRLISQEAVEKIQKLTEIKGKANDIVEVDVTEMTKEDRGRIHSSSKGLFGKAIVGSTVTKNDKKYITFAAFNKFQKVDRREKWLWPHRFVHFLLHKENEDTIQATSQLAELLKCSPSAFAYAGTKDRRAITTQWVSIKQFDPRRIAAAAAKIKQLTVGNFCFKPETLKLGQLRGNRFRIALRQVSAEESAIRETMESFQEKGFINYFGLQRFGNSATVPTYKVGIEILKGCWKEAFYLILKPRENDHWYMKACREEYEKSRDPERALDKLSLHNRSIEKQLLTWLVSHKNDYKCALEQIPRNVRLLYCHSYQSLIWNRVASRRLKELGHRLIPGDLVYVDKTVEAEMAIEDGLVEQQDNVIDDTPEKSTDTSYFKTLVKPLTEADIASGQYTIFDVVLPLPGHDITYPANECGQWYEEILAEDDLSSEKLKGQTKKESLGGAYRKMMIKPGNLQWKFTTYNDAKETLIFSDLEKLKGKNEPDAIKDASNRALILDFQLPSSTYATMALREILKADTSAIHQRTLEEEHSKKSDEPSSVSVTQVDKTIETPVLEEPETRTDNGSPKNVVTQQDDEDKPIAKKAKLD